VGFFEAITLASRALKAWDAFTGWVRGKVGKTKLESAADKADQTGDTSDLENAFGGGDADRK
jgi:hypothetical protein